MLGEYDFKPEIQKQGADLVAKGAVFLPIVGDLRIEGLIRGTTSAKVSMTSKSVGGARLAAHCNCVKFTKGQFCKHIWAVIKAVEVRHPDFLEGKTEIDRMEIEVDPKASPVRKVSEAQTAAAEKAKAKQADYRKEQYAKQKARVKEKKQAAKGISTSKLAPPPAALSEDVEEALKFFSQNGFEFEHPVAIETLRNAKKILSRIFHPDKGGTHEEMLEMNRHFDALTES